MKLYIKKTNEPSVLIMMATYNGEKYIAEQIESIIRQKYPHWRLVIQDDGSDDRTIEIIKRYIDLDGRIELFINANYEHGAYYNFHSLANRCKEMEKYDYYMFCDQDDVWDDDKITRLISEVKNINSDVPVLCYADMRIIDETNGVTADSINSIQGLGYVNKYSVFFSHCVYGCNVLMNAANFFSVPIIDLKNKNIKILSHDNLYTKFAAMLGQVIYLPDATMSYRRHSNNVTARQEYGFGIKRIMGRMKDIDLLAKDHALTYNQSLIAIDFLKQRNNKKLNLELNELKAAMYRGGISCCRYVIKKNISWGNKTKNISHFLVLLLGKHKKYLIKKM